MTLKRILKSSVMLCAVLAFSANAATASNLDAVIEKTFNKQVVDARGNCVRTKWSVPSDPCAAPVEEQLAAVVEKEPVASLHSEDTVVYFGFDSAALSSDSKAKLDRVAEALRGSASVESASIVGYTDRIGTDQYNLRLSKRRADAVKSYLASKGYVNTDVAEVRGLGKTASQSRCEGVQGRNALIECLWKDRRVEVEFNYKK